MNDVDGFLKAYQVLCQKYGLFIMPNAAYEADATSLRLAIIDDDIDLYDQTIESIFLSEGEEEDEQEEQ